MISNNNKRKTMTRHYKDRSDNFFTRMSQSSLGILFFVFVSCTFLLMFSFADDMVKRNDMQNYKEDNIEMKRVSNLKFALDNFETQKYTWICLNNKCVKKRVGSDGNNEEVTLDSCNMLCGDVPIWPQPKKFTLKSRKFTTISTRNIVFDTTNQDQELRSYLETAQSIFIDNINKLANNSNDCDDLNVKIEVSDDKFSKLSLQTREEYSLVINDRDALIRSASYFGARHALETLSQLIWYDKVAGELKLLNDVEVEDNPSFPYRGLMIDVARNYYPLWQLKKSVDGMAASKLNVLHLHISDLQSFPIVLPRIPELAYYGAYSSDMVYTVKQLKELKKYAQERGIRLILEVDSPGHMNAGWEFSKFYYNEEYVICNTLANPDNDNVLNILEDIYLDLLEITEEDEIFHIGGDEVNLDCWKNTKAYQSSNKDIKEFWADYENKIINRLKSANSDQYPRNIIIWSSPLTESTALKSIQGNITVQFWFGRPEYFLNAGYSVIYSTVGNWYLDCGFGAWKPSEKGGSCDPYTPWQTFYKYQPWKEYGHQEQALGGEACLWSEQVDVDTLETRLWPRTGAFAERVWSDPSGFDSNEVARRFVAFRERLISRGLKVAAIWPRMCSQNPGTC